MSMSKPFDWCLIYRAESKTENDMTISFSSQGDKLWNQLGKYIQLAPDTLFSISISTHDMKLEFVPFIVLVK